MTSLIKTKNNNHDFSQYLKKSIKTLKSHKKVMKKNTRYTMDTTNLKLHKIKHQLNHNFS